MEVQEIKNYGKDGEPTSRIFVTGAIQNASDDDLKMHFSKYGRIVSLYRPKDKDSGESSRCVFIYFENSDCADRALDEDHSINGQYIYVKRAHVEDSGSGWKQQRSKRRSESKNSFPEQKSLTLLISADPKVLKEISESDLKHFFSDFGDVASVRKPIDGKTRESMHFAFVEYSKSEAVDKAMSKLQSLILLTNFNVFLLAEKKHYRINGHTIAVSKSHS